MAVLKAFRQTPSALQRNPVLFVPVLAVMLLQVPQLVLQATYPLIASLVSSVLSLAFIVVMPFFLGGTIGMAHEALDGQTSLDRFISDGKGNYVSIFVAYLVIVVINFAIGIAAFLLAIFGGIAVFANGSGDQNLLLLGVIGLVGGLIVLAYLLLVFFVQFYGQAIVIDDLGAVDGLKHSISVVRANVVSTLGYTVLAGIFGGLVGSLSAVASILVSPQTASLLPLPELQLAGIVGVTLALVVIGTLFGGFFGVFAVAFYRTINTGVPDQPAS